jgi:hypothetical protein
MKLNLILSFIITALAMKEDAQRPIDFELGGPDREKTDRVFGKHSLTVLGDEYSFQKAPAGIGIGALLLLGSIGIYWSKGFGRPNAVLVVAALVGLFLIVISIIIMVRNDKLTEAEVKEDVNALSNKEGNIHSSSESPVKSPASPKPPIDKDIAKFLQNIKSVRGQYGWDVEPICLADTAVEIKALAQRIKNMGDKISNLFKDFKEDAVIQLPVTLTVPEIVGLIKEAETLAADVDSLRARSYSGVDAQCVHSMGWRAKSFIDNAELLLANTPISEPPGSKELDIIRTRAVRVAHALHLMMKHRKLRNPSPMLKLLTKAHDDAVREVAIVQNEEVKQILNAAIKKAQQQIEQLKEAMELLRRG